MSWVFSHPHTRDFDLTFATLGPPALANSEQRQRRQQVLESDAGQVWVQDLGHQDRYWNFLWPHLTPAEASGLRHVFEAALWQGDLIALHVEDDPKGVFVEIQPGMHDCEGPVKPGVYGAGDTVLATKFGLLLRLDTPSQVWEQQLASRAGINLRFREVQEEVC